MDPAALGTTLIGLEAIRASESTDESRRTDGPRPRRRPASRPSIRSAIAATLRKAAAAIDAHPPEPARGT